MPTLAQLGEETGNGPRSRNSADAGSASDQRVPEGNPDLEHSRTGAGDRPE